VPSKGGARIPLALCRYRGDFPVFSDDIQGIAAVVIAGMLAAQPLTGKSLSQHTFLFAGEGRGATATAEVRRQKR
jgi:malate dehydrogenase (oxaloacetate-decarboxylating)(NADP+)